MANYTYIYLHGFASSPSSSKAEYFKQKLSPHEVIIPDLNQDDFYHLTLSRQLEQVSEIITTIQGPIILFGSSMGGLTAMLLAEKYPNIAKVILLAPAFRMSELWANGDPVKLQEWKEYGFGPVMHYGYDKEMLLGYQFYPDLFKHDDKNFMRQLPVLNFHGINDDVVPIEFSREYQLTHPQSTLIELDDDHGLGNHLDFIWDKVKPFCEQ
jgi:pimeloyl-ACP methyl ester carboxylesterase